MERFSKKFHTTTSNKKYNRNPRLKKKSQTITSNHNLISNYPKSHSVHPKGTSKITSEWQKTRQSRLAENRAPLPTHFLSKYEPVTL